MAVRDRMKARREQTLQWDLKEAAHRIGIDYQYLWKLERGENVPPAWELLRKLADGYETSADWLLERTQDPSPPSQAELIYSARAGVYSPTSAPLTPAAEDILALLPALGPSRTQDLVSIAHAFAERDKGAAPTQEGGAEEPKPQSERDAAEHGEDVPAQSARRPPRASPPLHAPSSHPSQTRPESGSP